MIPAAPDAVAAKLREMGFEPTRARVLAGLKPINPLDLQPKPRGPRPSVPPSMLVGASSHRLRELAVEAGVALSSLYGLRARHQKRSTSAGRASA